MFLIFFIAQLVLMVWQGRCEVEEQTMLSVAIRARVAVVTGGNKGIGFAIVKGLCEQFQGVVYLTARNEERGLAAIKKLEEMGYHPQFHLLDITDAESIKKFKEYLLEEYGGLDVLINNAAIAFKMESNEPFGHQAEETMRVNYHALKMVCDILFPILRSYSRVVNMASTAGHLSRIPAKPLREKLASKNLTEPELTSMMDTFVKLAQTDDHTRAGWCNVAYAVSKVGACALTFIQQREISKDKTRKNIFINAVNPGYVATDMNNHRGNLTPEQGAVAPLFAALISEHADGPKGEYIWHDKQIISWDDVWAMPFEE